MMSTDDLDAAYHYIYMALHDLQANAPLDEEEAELVRGLKATLKLIRKEIERKSS